LGYSKDKFETGGITAVEIWKDFGIVAIRSVTLFPLLLATTLFMGRRSIGELPVFDFLVILSLGSVVGADIADPDIRHLPTAFAIVFIGLLQKTVAILVIRYRKFGRLITFEPAVMIYKGKLVAKHLRKYKYSIDNILQMLREQEIFDVTSVHLAVLEANGKLSVLKTGSTMPVTAPQLGLAPQQPQAAYPVIIEGKLKYDTLQQLHISEQQLYEQLRQRGVLAQDVFLAVCQDISSLNITLYEESLTLPPVKH